MDEKFVPMAENFSLSQEISLCHRKFLSVTGNIFLSQDISSCNRKFVPLEQSGEKGGEQAWDELGYAQLKLQLDF